MFFFFSCFLSSDEISNKKIDSHLHPLEDITLSLARANANLLFFLFLTVLRVKTQPSVFKSGWGTRTHVGLLKACLRFFNV